MNMLNKLLSDSFWCGIDILIVGRISVIGIFIGGIFDLGSNIGSDGEDDVDSIIVSSEGVDDDSSFFVSDFFKRKKQTHFPFFLFLSLIN
jgi:hypothetical protein